MKQAMALRSALKIRQHHLPKRIILGFLLLCTAASTQAQPAAWPVQNSASMAPTGDIVVVRAGEVATFEGVYTYAAGPVNVQSVTVMNTNLLAASVVVNGTATNVQLLGRAPGVSAIQLRGLYFDWNVENPDHTWGAWVTNAISYGVLVRATNGAAIGLPTTYTPIGSRAVMGNPDVEKWYQNGANTDPALAHRTDIIDIYMQGGPCSWVYQNSDWDTAWYPGKYLYNFIRACKRQGRIPCIVFYCIPPSGVGDSAMGALYSVSETPGIRSADDSRYGGYTQTMPWVRGLVPQTNYMTLYYHRTIRVMRECLYKTTSDGWPCLVVIEPDFIGYMSANLGQPVDPNTNSITVNLTNYSFKVTRAFDTGPAETAGPSQVNGAGTNTCVFNTEPLLAADERTNFPNTLKGFATSIPHIFRKPFTLDGQGAQLGDNVMIGWKLNLWASKIGGGYTTNVGKPTGTDFGVGKGIIRWTDATGQGTPPNGFGDLVGYIRGEAAGIARYYLSVGIAQQTDYLFIDRYGIDAASKGFVDDPASSTWFWNHDHWNNYLAFVASVQQTVNLPIILWQMPMGHINQSDALKPGGGPYVPLSNATNGGSFEDSSASFWLGDTFSPGGARRTDYFATSEWADYDPARAADVMVSKSDIRWAPAIARLPGLGIAALLNGPGVGRDSSTFACAQDTAASADDSWWINKVQQYYLQQPALADPD